MSPDLVFWLGRAWYTLPAISVKVRDSVVQFPGDCTSCLQMTTYYLDVTGICGSLYSYV